MSSTPKPAAQTPASSRGPVRLIGESSEDAKIARLFHRECRRAGPEALAVLRDALAVVHQNGRCLLLMTAGLVWAERDKPTEHMQPSEAEFAELTQQARQIAEELRAGVDLTPEDPDILLGIDLYTRSSRG